jgi:gliding motility-associated-like protein
MRYFLLILIHCVVYFSPNRIAAQPSLTIGSVSIPCIAPGTITVPVTVNNFTNIGSFQGTISWDPTKLTFVGPVMLLAPFTSTGVVFGTDESTYLSQGKITFSWFKVGGVTAPNGAIPFNLKFNYIGGGLAPITFQIAGAPPSSFEITDLLGDAISGASGINGGISPIDNVNPTVTCPANFTTNSNTPVVVNAIAASNITDNCGTPTVGWVSTGATSITTPNDNDASGASFNVGTSTVTYTATDAANNTATCSFTVNVNSIFVPPAVPDTLKVLVGTSTSSCGGLFSIPVTVQKFDSIGSLQFSMHWNPAVLKLDSVGSFLGTLGINAPNFNLMMTASGDMSFSWTTISTYGNNIADNTALFRLYFKVLSYGGGSSTLQFTNTPSVQEAFSSAVIPPVEVPVLFASNVVTITDNTPPFITCPSNVSQPVDLGFTYAAIAGLTASAIDNCGGVPTISYTRSGSVNTPGMGGSAAGNYNAGATTVTYTATDAAGNTATCATIVQINGINPVVLSADTVNTACAPVGSIITVPIRVRDFDAVAGLTFNLNWDETVLSMTGITGIYPGLNLNLYPQIYQDTAMGDFHFLDGNASGWPNIPNNGIFFSLTFRVLNAGGIANLNFYGTNSIPLEALDANGNPLAFSIANGLVTFGDNIPPVLSGCPSDFIAFTNANSCDVNVILALPTATDNCGLNGVVTSTHPTPTYGLGINIVFFQATDQAGNTATCTTVITVKDNKPPVLSNCPPPITVFANPLFCNQIVNIPSPTATDACSGMATVVSDHASNIFSVGQTTVIFSATDTASNTSTCSVIVTVKDTTAPVLNNCPTSITIDAVNNECNQTVILTNPTASDACIGLASLVSSHPSSNYNSGQTIVIYTATDFAGNSSTCSLTVTVTDDIAPQLFNCPSNIVVFAQPDQCSKVVSWSSPLATDGCGNTSLTLTSNIPNGSIFTVGASTIIYTVTDNTNNAATCSFTVTVRDTIAPTLTCPSNVYDAPQLGQCSMVINWNEPTSSDFCDSTISYYVTTHASGDTFAINTVTNVTYTGFDAFGNSSSCTFEVKIVDITPPILNACPQNITVEANSQSPTQGCGTYYTWVQPTLTGVCSQTGNFILSSSSPGDFFPLGTTEVEFKGFNQNGFFDSCAFTIKVIDNAGTTFQNFPADQILTLSAGNCDTVVNWTAPTVIGSLCAAPTVTSSIASGTNLPVGIHFVTYTATDAVGQQTTRSFSIQVIDKTPPVIAGCSPNITTSTGSGCTVPVFWSPITATDDCDPSVTIIPGYVSGDVFPPGETTVRILAVDNNMNYDTCEFKVFVVGSSMPSITNCPSNQLFTGCDAVGSWVVPGVSGFCTPPVLTSNYALGSIFPIGVTTVTYTATTASDTAICKFTITVNESVAPSFNCPANITVDASGRIVSDANNFVQSASHNAACDGVTLNFLTPTANDNCANPTVTQTNGGLSGTVFSGTSTINFKAEDAAGNSSNCNVKITIIPLTALTANVDPNPACEGAEVKLWVVDSIPGANYTWTGPQQNYPNTAVITLLGLSEGNAGDYTVFATINGCETPSTTATVTLVVKPNAVDDGDVKVKAGENIAEINVIANDINVPPDAVITLIGAPAGVVYEGDGIFSYSGSQTPQQLNFLYEVCSKTCPDKCDQAQVTITIQDTRCVFIPNIISPNGDGINDWFDIPCIETGEYPNNELTIYNQWGDKVFHASPYISTPTSAWKGTLDGVDGKDLPDGVYYYIFKTKPDGEVYKKFIEIYR